jgi:hypothetical protein
VGGRGAIARASAKASVIPSARNPVLAAINKRYSQTFIKDCALSSFIPEKRKNKNCADCSFR